MWEGMGRRGDVRRGDQFSVEGSSVVFEGEERGGGMMSVGGMMDSKSAHACDV